MVKSNMCLHSLDMHSGIFVYIVRKWIIGLVLVGCFRNSGISGLFVC